MINEISEMKEKVTQLTGIWSDIGINYEATRNRLDRTRTRLANLLDQMLDGENDMKCTLLKNIEKFTSQVQQLSVELAVAVPEVPDSLTATEKENIIRKRLERLKKIKNSRKLELKRLRAKESELCTRLGVPALNHCSGFIPSEKDLHDLQNHVTALEQEKVTRSCTLALLREDIVAKLNLLNIQPEGQLEIQLINDLNVYVLSEGNIKEMKHLCIRCNPYILQLP
ncbi:hypothetical protein HPB50_026044 [Hyalomma asiaticum]|uniref:Uncharacterized protein n=1 Tax=Hyalomma asiaticum TaxID=266040 RepID=A0ACB7SX66_HYAAI|nr:hypothetical protein HPB50_026044 [Hyalomma asiaticum]